MLVVAGKFCFYVYFNSDWHIRLQKPVHPTVILDRHNDDRQNFGVLTLVSKPSHARTAIVENGSSGSAVIASIPAGDNDSSGMLGGEKCSCLFAEGQPLDELLDEVFALADVHGIFG